MSDPVSLARAARENLARGLAALQSPSVPPQVMVVAEPIANAMSALHRVEASGGAARGEAGPAALNAARQALAMLQQQPQGYPAVDQALEAIAGSLNLIHQLAQAPAAAPQAAAFAGTVAMPPGQAGPATRCATTRARAPEPRAIPDARERRARTRRSRDRTRPARRPRSIARTKPGRGNARPRIPPRHSAPTGPPSPPPARGNSGRRPKQRSDEAVGAPCEAPSLPRPFPRSKSNIAVRRRCHHSGRRVFMNDPTPPRLHRIGPSLLFVLYAVVYFAGVGLWLLIDASKPVAAEEDQPAAVA